MQIQNRFEAVKYLCCPKSLCICNYKNTAQVGKANSVSTELLPHFFEIFNWTVVRVETADKVWIVVKETGFEPMTHCFSNNCSTKYVCFTRWGAVFYVYCFVLFFEKNSVSHKLLKRLLSTLPLSYSPILSLMTYPVAGLQYLVMWTSYKKETRMRLFLFWWNW